MRYYIDGYNFLFYWCNLEKPLQQKRSLLIQFLQENFSSLTIQLYLVFDGYSREEEELDFHTIKKLHIIFTAKKQTADDYIVECFSYAKNPAELTVITNDQPLARNCRGLGAQSLSLEKFLKTLHHKKDKETKKNLFAEKAFEESPSEIKRLITIFEKRLKDFTDE